MSAPEQPQTRSRRRRITALVSGALPLAATLAVVPLAVTSSVAATAPTDSCGYPTSTTTRTATTFNESTVTKLAQVFGTGASAHIGVFATDEKSLLLGLGPDQNSALTPTLFTTSNALVTYGHQNNPSLGDLGATDTTIAATAQPRPIFPTLFLTDVTALSAAQQLPNVQQPGDWQKGTGNGSPITTVGDIYGTWTTASFVAGIYKTTSLPTKSNIDGAGNWLLGPGSDSPSGTTFQALGKDTFATEVTWPVSSLNAQGASLLGGHTYKVQVMTHDGDQNKTGGDVGEYCTTLTIPAPHSGIAKAQKDVTQGATTFTHNTVGSPLTGAKPGDTIDYKLTYTNTGNASATNVVIDDTLPGHSTYNSDCVPNTCSTATAGHLIWNLGTETAGASVDLSFSVTLDATFPSGDTHVTNSVLETSDGESDHSDTVSALVSAASVSNLVKTEATIASTSLACNSATLNNTQITSNQSCVSVLGPPVASPAFTAGPLTAHPGDVIRYKLTYSNSGNSDATGIDITDAIPPLSAFVAGSASCDLSCVITPTVVGGVTTSLDFDLGVDVVAPGHSTSVFFNVKLNASLPVSPAACNIPNTASVTSTDAPTSVLSGTVCITGSGTAKPALVKSPPSAPDPQTGNFSYTITLYNTGDGDMTGQGITDQLPANLNFISCTPVQSCTGPTPGTTGTVGWLNLTVPAGGSVVVSVTVHP